MPTYATQADCLAYTEGLSVDDPTAMDRLIERCERDIDKMLPWAEPYAATGLKIDPLVDIEAWQADFLRDAVCAQVEYRLQMGEEFFTKSQPGEVTTPEFSYKGKLWKIAPKAIDELLESDLLKQSGAVATRDLGTSVEAWAGNPSAWHPPLLP